MNKEQLEKEMTDLNYNGDAMSQAEDILDLINEQLESGEAQDLEEALDNAGIYHRRVR